jgi:hypothetical protein
LYAYVGNSPVNYIDFSGLESDPVKDSLSITAQGSGLAYGTATYLEKVGISTSIGEILGAGTVAEILGAVAILAAAGYVGYQIGEKIRPYTGRDQGYNLLDKWYYDYLVNKSKPVPVQYRTRTYEYPANPESNQPAYKQIDIIEIKNGEETVIDTVFITIPPSGGGGGGGSAGDPHISTFDGYRYDLQAAGEFTLFKSTTDDLNVQVRQEPISSPWGGRWVSVNTALATLIDGHRVGIYINEDIPLKIEGVATDLANGASLDLGTGRIERHNERYTLIYPTGDRIDVGLYNHSVIGNYININTYLTNGREGEIVGILGNNNSDSSDDFTLADGTILTPPLNFEQLYNQFANSWRITEDRLW